MHAFLAACKSGNFDLANKEVNNFIAEGYPVSQLLSQVCFRKFEQSFLPIIAEAVILLKDLLTFLFLKIQLLEAIIEADDLSDEQKARICKKLGEVDKVLRDSDILSEVDHRFLYFKTEV